MYYNHFSQDSYSTDLETGNATMSLVLSCKGLAHISYLINSTDNTGRGCV